MSTTNKIETQNVTRNQSTAQFTFDHIFLGNNRYDEITLKNTIGSAEKVVEPGSLLIKTAATEVDVLDAAANIENVVGIIRLDQAVTMTDDAELEINMCTTGLVAEELIELPSGVTLDTVIPTTQRTLRDRLNELGFSLEGSVENTKFDNV